MLILTGCPIFLAFWQNSDKLSKWLNTLHGVVVGELSKLQTIVSEFDSHQVPHMLSLAHKPQSANTTCCFWVVTHLSTDQADPCLSPVI